MHIARTCWSVPLFFVFTIVAVISAVAAAEAATCEMNSSLVRITEVDVGATLVNNEDEAALKPLVISPIPSGGSRLAWTGSDGKVHVTTLDGNDQIKGASFALPANDFSDLYADDNGGVLLMTRDAQGGGTLNCGSPANLCGTAPNPPVSCFDMYMVRFDGTSETWATKLTSSSASLPPYSTGPSGPEVYMIWWYAHHGRIASDGTNFAGYFGSAISVSQNSCINIHQGDRMKVVGPTGALQSGGFDWGCSHSGYERILWDSTAKKYVTVCKTDNNNRIAFAPDITTIYPVDLNYSNLGNLVSAKGGGYWLTSSNIRSGQPANSNGLADVRLLHFSSGVADKNLLLASDSGLNDRAPHLAPYGPDRLLAAWETSTATGDLSDNDGNRKLYVQTLDAATGAAEGSPHQVAVTGNRYQDFRSFPDGSVAYAAPGSGPTKIKILRILPCGGVTPPENSSAITPATAKFDKNTSAQTDIAVTMTLNGNTFNGIKNGSTALVQGTDFTLSGTTLTILKGYLAKQVTGTLNLTFDFSAGADPALAVTISDTRVVTHTLNISVSGNGTTNPATGAHAYASGTTVSVTATPASGATFTGWSGAATGTTNPMTITVNADKSLVAGFSSGSDGSCVDGTTSTTWATSCSTPANSCVSGTWTPAGSNNDDPLQYESAHFAFYWTGTTVTTAQAQAAANFLEDQVWTTYMGSPIYFPEPYCNSSDKKKASIHIRSDYALWGGPWGNGYMGMWIGPGALADHWGLAHEFNHALQGTTGGLANCNPNTCGWIWESHSNFMPHQLAEYQSNTHCSEMLANAPHLYLGSTRDRYCNWQWMEFLKDKYCYKAVNDIWTGSATQKQGDPFLVMKTNMGWSQAQLNDFFGEWAMHNITWDYKNPPPTSQNNAGSMFRSNYGAITDVSRPERRLRVTQLEPVDLTNRRFATPSAWAPQRWGYNVVRLYPEDGAGNVTVTFRGVTGGNNGWRWGLVATDAELTTARYSPVQPGTDGQLSFCVKSGESLWLVVAGAPTVHETIVWDQMYNTVHRYPWMVQLEGAWPEGWQGGTQAACASGLVRHENGGGCAPASLASSVHVGPYAQVLGENVSGNAWIDDHATILNGTVTSGTVAGLTVLSDSFSVSGGTLASTFYPMGFFESGQSISGTAQVIGDAEYRGQGLNKSSGTFYGFVDSSTSPASNTTDVSPAPPYTWRP